MDKDNFVDWQQENRESLVERYAQLNEDDFNQFCEAEYEQVNDNNDEEENFEETEV